MSDIPDTARQAAALKLQRLLTLAGLCGAYRFQDPHLQMPEISQAWTGGYGGSIALKCRERYTEGMQSRMKIGLKDTEQKLAVIPYQLWFGPGEAAK